MASIRKRYADRVEASPRQDGPPVTAPPTGAAKLPDPVADPKQPEMPATESPADVAAKNALRARLQEMERAETLNRQAAQEPPHAAEPQQPQPQQPAMPPAVEKWLTEHPQYLDPNDHVAQAEMQLATVKCVRDKMTWDHPDFIPTIERHLGIAPRPNGQAQHRPIERPPAPAAPRHEAPVRQQRSVIPVSAPPTREVPSMASGRVPSRRVPLTPEQREAARFSGISEEKYAEKLELMNQMKAAGVIQDGGR